MWIAEVPCLFRFVLVWEIQRDFVGVFNKTIIPLALVGYEMIIANLALRASLAIYHLISNAPSWNNLLLHSWKLTSTIHLIRCTGIMALWKGKVHYSTQLMMKCPQKQGWLSMSNICHVVWARHKCPLSILTAGWMRKCKGFPWRQRKLSELMRSLYWAGVHTAGFDSIMNSNHNNYYFTLKKFLR